MCVERLRPIETAELSAIRNTNDNVCSPAEVQLLFSSLSTRYMYGRSISLSLSAMLLHPAVPSDFGTEPCAQKAPDMLDVSRSIHVTTHTHESFCGNATFSKLLSHAQTFSSVLEPPPSVRAQWHRHRTRRTQQLRLLMPTVPRRMTSSWNRRMIRMTRKAHLPPEAHHDRRRNHCRNTLVVNTSLF